MKYKIILLIILMTAITNINSTTIADNQEAYKETQTEIDDYEEQTVDNIYSHQKTISTTFSFTFDDNYSTYRLDNVLQKYYFVRSGQSLGYTIDPIPSEILFAWDDGQNLTTIPVVPSILAISEVHTLKIFAKTVSDPFEYYETNFTIDNSAVITTLVSPTKVKVNGSNSVVLSHDKAASGVTWSWNSGVYTALPIINFPKDSNSNPIEGTQILRVKVLDQQYRTWDYDFVFFVDWNAPAIILLNAGNNSIYDSGYAFQFENKTPILPTDDKYDFSFSWNDGLEFKEMPILPIFNGNYKLKVNLSDEIGNKKQLTYYFQAKIGIQSINPEFSGKPNQLINISFTETPSFENYTLYYNNPDNGSEIIIFTNMTSPGTLPDLNQNITFMLNVNDTGNNWTNLTYSIKVDGYPIKYLSSSHGNYSTYTQGIVDQNIVLTFNETPDLIIYYFNNTNINSTAIPKIPLSTGNYLLIVYFSDLAGNWDQIKLFFTRTLKITTNITNDLIIYPQSVMKFDLSGNFTTYFNNQTNPTVMSSNNYINILSPGLSGYYNFNMTVLSNNTYISQIITFYVKIRVTVSDDLNRPYKSGLKVNYTFSEAPYTWFYVWDNPNDVNNYKFDGIPLIPTSDGTHTIYFKMYNSQDNKEYIESFAVITDNIKPIITLTLQNNTAQIVNKVLTYTLSADVQVFQYRWNDDDYSSDQMLVTPEIQGQNILEIAIEDKAGNSNHYIFVFYIDLEKPVINETKINNSIVYPNEILEFNFSEPIDLVKSQYEYNGEKRQISDQILLIKLDSYGNKTIEIDFFILDLFNNSRNSTFFYQMIDPALTLSVSVEENAILKNSEKIKITLSKEVKSFNAIWIKDNETVTPNYQKIGTEYRVELPNVEGIFQLNYTIVTHDDYRVSKIITYRIDYTGSQLVLKYYIVNPENDSLVKILTDSGTLAKIYNVTNLSEFEVSITDITTVSGNYTLEYSNGTKITKIITKNKILFTTPDLNEQVEISINAIDEAGHVTSLSWTLVVYDKAIVTSGYELLLVLSSCFVIIIVRKSKKV
jgi:hypothetical protein